MAEIPLILRLKKKTHKDVAKAQDVLVETLYGVFSNAVLHGGTAIWRCYDGKRFSEDLDFYIEKNTEKINKFFEEASKKGFSVEKKKIGKNSLYSTLKFEREIVGFEALFKNVAKKKILKEYEKAEGNYLTVYTLTPEELVKEKVEAYLKRRKIRDLYDVFFLMRCVKNVRDVKKELNELIKNFKKPVDREELKVLVTEGIVPGVEDMLNYIKRIL